MSVHKSTSVTVDEYHLPTGTKGLGALACAALMVLSARRKFIEPRSILHDQVIARGGAHAVKYSKPVQDFLFYYFFGVHGAETVYFALTKLKRHKVKVLSTVWLEWIVTIFLGGFFGTQHFDEVVEKKEIKTIKEI